MTKPVPIRSDGAAAAQHIFQLAVVTAGLGTLLVSLAWQIRTGAGYEWVILALLTVVSSHFTVRIPGFNTKVSISETFSFTSTMLFGPAAGCLTAAVDGLVGSLRTRTRRRRAEYVVFNVATLALAGRLAGEAFSAVLGRSPLYGSPPVTLREMLPAAATLAFAYYLVNASAVATVTALESRRNVFRVWREGLLWTLPAYLVCASSASFVAVNVTAFTLVILAALLPVLLLLHLTYRTQASKMEGEQQNKALMRLHLKTVETLALAVDVKDPITYGHVRRVRGYCRELARLGGVADENELVAIEMAALMHDIGKLAVDESIITKPGPLTSREFEEVKKHCEAGSEILEQIESPSPVASYVRSHHERWDGLGYPDGLKAERIPFGARVLAIVDAYDTARSSRPYKRPLDTRESLDALESGAGTLYDPELVRLFVDNLGRLERAAEHAGGGKVLSFARSPEQYRGRAPDAAAASRPPSVSLEMSSLGDFCKGPAIELEMGDLLAVIAGRIGRFVPNDTCVIFVKNGGRKLYARGVTGVHAGRLRGAELLWGHGISGWVAAHKLPIMNSSPALDFDDLHSPGHGMADTLSVPVVAGDICVGAITLYSTNTGHFTAAQLELLQDIAQVVAPVIELARFREGLSAESGIVEGDSRTYPASHFTAMASAMIASAREQGAPLSLVCADFETPGGVRPDRRAGEDQPALRRLAAIVRAELRDPAAIFYFGTHRLVALLEGVDAQEALLRGSRMQLRICNMSIGGQRGPKVACQVGVASLPDDGVTLKVLLEAAERQVAGTQPRPAFLRARRPRTPSQLKGTGSTSTG